VVRSRLWAGIVLSQLRTASGTARPE